MKQIKTKKDLENLWSFLLETKKNFDEIDLWINFYVRKDAIWMDLVSEPPSEEPEEELDKENVLKRQEYIG